MILLFIKYSVTCPAVRSAALFFAPPFFYKIKSIIYLQSAAES
jgi:hypothetical protein